jgi:PqqD family protein of HPr-rel-A system
MSSIRDTARFGDGTLVLNARSWETHFLNSEAARVLDLLRAAPGSETELLAELLSDEEASDEERRRYGRQLEEALASLEVLGLIEVDDEARR